MTGETSFTAVAFIHIKHGTLLLVRPKGKHAYYLPGGKPEAGESEIETLVRECAEELSISVDPMSLTLYRECIAQAYAEPAGVRVILRCFRGSCTGTPAPMSEIESIRFFTSEEYQREKETAPAVRLLFASLRRDRLVL